MYSLASAALTFSRNTLVSVAKFSTKTPRKVFLPLLIHGFLILWVVYSVTPFAWALLTSSKRHLDAVVYRPPTVVPDGIYAATPDLFLDNIYDPDEPFLYTPIEDNYEELWLEDGTTVEDLTTIGYGLAMLFVVLTLLAYNAERLQIPKALVATIILAAVVGVATWLPTQVEMAEFYDYFLNSIIVTAATVAISIFIGCLAGYGLARYAGIMGVVILFTALAFRALPRMAFVLPYYYMGQRSGLYDTHLLLVITLVAINQPFTIWMLRSFFMEIPREIEEAAMIDGCNRFQAFFRVIIPITWPGIITTSLFTVLLAYNEFLMPKLLMQENLTMPVAISPWTSGEDVSHLRIAAAGSVSITLPIIVLIIFFQKYLVKGLTFGAVKG